MSSRSRVKPTRFNYRFSSLKQSASAAAEGEASALSILSLSYWKNISIYRYISIFCIITNIPAIVLYITSFHQSTGLITNSGYDPSGMSIGAGIAHGRMGFNYICFTGEFNGTVGDEHCSLGSIDNTCAFQYDNDAVAFLENGFGQTDNQLSGCAEWNAYRATHVLGLLLTCVSVITMFFGHMNFRPIEKYTFKCKLTALIVTFLAGFMGVAAQCFLIDWMNFNAQNLITLGPLFAVPLPINVNIDEASFHFIAAWVLNFLSALAYILHFPNTLAH